MISEELKMNLGVVGVTVTHDVEGTEEEFGACVEYGENERYVLYDGTDESFLDALDDLAADDSELWDMMADFHKMEANRRLMEFHRENGNLRV